MVGCREMRRRDEVRFSIACARTGGVLRREEEFPVASIPDPSYNACLPPSPMMTLTMMMPPPLPILILPLPPVVPPKGIQVVRLQICSDQFSSVSVCEDVIWESSSARGGEGGQRTRREIW